MKKREINIDNLFKEKLSDARISAPADAWENIEGRISNKKSKKLIYYWPVAASFLAIIGLGYILSSRLQNTENEISKSDDIINTKQIGDKTIGNLSNQLTSKEQNSHSDLTELSVPAKTNTLQDYKPVSFENSSNTTSEKELSIIDSSLMASELVTNRATITEPVKNTSANNFPSIFNAQQPINQQLIYEDHQAVNNSDNSYNLPEKIKVDKTDRITIAGHAAPLYSYRNIIGGGATNYNETEAPIMAYSGGINVSVQTSRRLSISSGVYYSKMGQQISNEQVFEQVVRTKNSSDYLNNTVSVSNSTGEISTTHSSNKLDLMEYSMISENQLQSKQSDVEQAYEFIEVPVLARYKLIDRKIEFTFISGVSANILVDQQANFTLSDGTKITSDIENLNTFNYGSALGLGLGYEVFDNVAFSVEPMFKYYFSSLNNKSEIESHPWSVGLYTGLSYSF